MQHFITGAILFVIAVSLIELLKLAIRSIRNPDKTKIIKRLRKTVYLERKQDVTSITKQRVLSSIPFVNRLLINTPGILKLNNLISQANAKQTIGFFILLALVFALIGFLTGKLIIKNQLAMLSFFFIGGSFPFLYLFHLKGKRIKKFKRQLPEALDLMARALKAGHAFTNGMKLAADEFEDPLGLEFSEALDEINFGVTVPDALRNMARRINCSEIRYFVVGVILQRETGGNLAELMGILSYLIREKFKFEGKVRTLSAEGRLSAIILVALPFFIAGYLQFSNPKYLSTLFADPIGQMMMIGAAIMMVIGIIVMKKMVTIEV